MLVCARGHPTAEELRVQSSALPWDHCWAWALTCACLCAGVCFRGFRLATRGTLEWIMGAAEAGARLWPSSGAEWIILWVFSGCQPLLCWGKSHLHIAEKSPVLLGSGKWSSADLVCKNGSRCCFYQKSSRGWTGWKRKKSGEREKKTTENPQGSNGAEKKGMGSLMSSLPPSPFVGLCRIINL